MPRIKKNIKASKNNGKSGGRPRINYKDDSIWNLSVDDNYMIRCRGCGKKEYSTLLRLHELACIPDPIGFKLFLDKFS